MIGPRKRLAARRDANREARRWQRRMDIIQGMPPRGTEAREYARERLLALHIPEADVDEIMANR